MSSDKYRKQDVRAARGTTLTAKSWLTEAPLRMLMTRDCRVFDESRKRRNAAGAIRQTGWRIQNP
ncbi:hypothetical protein T636_A1423 [Enterobacter hormaechei subsp. xiangfangensis]|nr:hypothetical protein T636_A1423 [Enterobacter hormaechei subsp. xiangfangensis]